MFLFVVKYLGQLKYIPGLAIVFDSWLKLWSLITKPAMLDWIDEVEEEVLKWEHTHTSMHKFGGLQLNYHNKEIGHIHSNGLLDLLLSRKIKQQLMQDGFIEDHHYLKDTGWISFYIQTANDRDYAIKLLRLGYHLKIGLFAPGSDHQTSLPAIVTMLT